jgi:hypothetical protein
VGFFLNTATGVANEKWNSPQRVQTEKLRCSIENLKKYQKYTV